MMLGKDGIFASHNTELENEKLRKEVERLNEKLVISRKENSRDGMIMSELLPGSPIAAPRALPPLQVERVRVHREIDVKEQSETKEGGEWSVDVPRMGDSSLMGGGPSSEVNELSRQRSQNNDRSEVWDRYLSSNIQDQNVQDQGSGVNNERPRINNGDGVTTGKGFESKSSTLEKENTFVRRELEMLKAQSREKIVREEKKAEEASGSSNLLTSLFMILAYFMIGIVVYSQVEEWSFGDSLYFCLTTALTIGYGDPFPITTAGKWFTCAYILVGLCCFGVVLGALASHTIDSQEEILEAMRQASEAEDEPRKTKDKGCVQVRFSPAFQGSLESFVVLMVMLLIGTLYFCLQDQELSFVDSFYVSVVTLTTVGYGDMSPQSTEARAFAVFWICFGVGMVGRFLGCIADIVLESRRNRKEDERLARIPSIESLLLETNEGSRIDMTAFTLMKLRLMGKVSEADLELCRRSFLQMDVDHTGSIDVIGIKQYIALPLC